MPVTRDMLVAELQNLLRLTAFEQTIATVRRTQARTAALEQELAENAGKAGERQALLTQAIHAVGGVPDVVGSAVGRLGAFTTTQLNQVQTLQGALLGDLTLEHQLRERTRYARTLAQSLGETEVLPVLDRLETAHSATIDWLEARLAEVGRTGTSLLRATPLQAVVTGARRVAVAPLGVAVGTVNQASALLTRLAGKAPQPLQAAVSSAVGTATDAAATAVDTGVHAARIATQRTQDAAVAAGTGAEALAADARETVTEAADDVVDSAKAVVTETADAVEQAAGSVTQTVTEAAGTAADAVEQAAGSVTQTVTEAAGTAADTVSDAVSTAADTVSDAATSAAGTVSDAASTAADTVTDAASTAAGTVSDAAEAVDTTVADLAEEAKDAAEDLEDVDLAGTGEVAHPFAGYEKLSGDRVMGHVRDTEDVAELEQILAFETANKARKGVLAAVQQRLATLSTSA